MAKFLSNDRKRILLSSLLGTAFITIGGILATKESGFLYIPGWLIMIFTYFIFQFAIFVGREVRIIKGKIFNADGEDITKRASFFTVVQAFFIVPISIFLEGYLHNFIISLRSEYSLNENIINHITSLLVLITPYLALHLFFFIKNVPNIVILLYGSSGSSTNGHSSRNDDYYSHPSYSFLSSNIYNNYNKRN